MNEKIINPESRKINRESRFGDVDKIIDILSNGEVIRIGSIEEICDDIPDHANQVDIYDLSKPNANEILGVEIQAPSGDKIRCIFKPASGESQETKHKTMVESFYPRECSAYLISDHFDLDIVPPTVIRKINGQVGSLQLYLDHAYFVNFSRIEGEGLDVVDSSDDWKVIAVLDWILANCERHYDNMMVKKDNLTQIVAIDHGIVMSPPNYAEMMLRGPSLQLTYDGKKEKSKSINIPDDIMGMLQDGYDNKEELTEKLEHLNVFSEHEITSMWMRVEKMLEYKKYLSKMNHKEITGISFLGAGY